MQYANFPGCCKAGVLFRLDDGRVPPGNFPRLTIAISSSIQQRGIAKLKKAGFVPLGTLRGDQGVLTLWARGLTVLAPRPTKAQQKAKQRALKAWDGIVKLAPKLHDAMNTMEFLAETGDNL